MNVLLIVVSAVVIVLLAVSVVLDCLFRRKVGRFVADVRGFVEPGGKNIPSPLATITDNVLDLAASKISSSLTHTLLGHESGIARGQRALEADIKMDAAGAINPAIPAILSQMPNVQKRLRKNPELADLAVQLVGNLLNKAQAGGGAGTGYVNRENGTKGSTAASQFDLGI